MSFQDAIDKLNTFQTPFAVIEARRKAGIKPDESQIRSTRAYWARLGHTVSLIFFNGYYITPTTLPLPSRTRVNHILHYHHHQLS